MKKLRVAIIGQGRSGRNIHGAFFRSESNNDRFEVVAVVEKLELRRQHALEEYAGCAVYEDHTELYARDDIDLVINCTTSEQHVPVTRDLLLHGFNVVCEKPAAKYAWEVDMLMAAATQSGKMYNIFQQSRFAPYYRKVKEIINSGVLGRIVEINITYNGFNRRYDWQTLQDFNGGGLYNSGPHPLDQALDLLDMYDGMPNIMCKMDCVNTYGDANDYCKLVLTAQDKPLICIDISSCDPYSTYTYKIMAKNGGLTGTMTDIKWKYYKPEEAPEQHLIRETLSDENGYPAFCKDKLKWYEENWNAYDSGAFTDAVNSYYTMIYDYLVEGKPMEIMPYQVRQQIAVAEEAHRQNPLPKITDNK